jgi:FAD/FMN-containing dehydrogenase
MCKDHLPEKKIALQELVTSLGGSFASEHGIGKLKALFFRQNYNNRHRICKQIKQALDPKEIMNPGKVTS